MRWTVGLKIGAGFVLALIILIIIGASSYRSTEHLIEAGEWRAHTYTVLGNLEHLLLELRKAEAGARGYVLTGEDSYLQPYNDALMPIDNAFAELQHLTADNSEQQHRLELFEPLLKIKMNAMKNYVEQRRKAGFNAALTLVLGGVGKQAMDDMSHLAKEIETAERELLKTREQRLLDDSNRTLAIILYGIPAALVLLAIVGWVITRNIAEPLREVAAAATQIAAGDLSVQLKETVRGDEVGELVRAFSAMTHGLQQMAALAERIAAGDISGSVTPQSDKDMLGNAFATMIDKLRNMTREINAGVNVLVAAAAEILAATRQMSAGSAETVAAVSQTSSTVEEVKQTTQMASQKARLVSDSAQQTAQVSQLGKQSLQESSAAMQRIQEQMTSIAHSIVRLSEQGQAIGEIIATVNSLAEQSNLLAVNASIEAAKAGEQGKGFVVVAQEVKSLAAQSKQATAQVRTILGEIQRATAAAAMTTELGGKEVAIGTQLSASLGTAIGSLADNIDNAAQAATQIAASAQQQLVGMDQVALAMQNIKEATSQSLASTQQTESAAQNLHQLGLTLKGLVEQYRL